MSPENMAASSTLFRLFFPDKSGESCNNRVYHRDYNILH